MLGNIQHSVFKYKTLKSAKLGPHSDNWDLTHGIQIFNEVWKMEQ